MGDITKKRNYYYKKVMQYKKRRDEHKKKLYAARVSYSKSVKNINKKIKSWNREIRRIDEKTDYVNFIGSCVARFTGVNIKHMRNAKQKKLTIPKFLFYKYGLENKIMAIYLENYVGVKGNGVASNSRRRFNKLLLSDVEIKSQWESFKIFVDENRVK